ncbi:MAG: tRNA pseudouridine(38-40) synthase TruA [Bacteriovorax sp. MedPE-SWde]|nr:MAG: tRNA pseudouridine(38-40) synthase TruA [Bacteriovorax sp. MedPE-SWde]
MKFYKGVVQYNGTSFFGWQKQPDQITIQGELEKVVSRLNGNKEIQVIGSGRTDTAVHSIGQVFKITMPNDFEESKLLKGMNGLLPEDIVVSSLERCDENFQPVFDAKSKTYKYYFSTSDVKSPHLRSLVTFLDYDVDLALMNEACQQFVGEKDFVNFHTVGTPVKTTVREIFSCEVEEVVSGEHSIYPDKTYVLIVTGSGFLKQMVRLIMSAIWAVGRERVGIEKLSMAFDTKLEQKVAATAPPQGLYLYEVKY